MPSTEPTQTWNAQGYAENARFVAELGEPVIDLLAPQAGERILDLGCGDGALTVKLVERGATVVGVDLSEELLSQARQRGLDARLGNGEQLAFSAEFDAVFTNAALHWMRQAGSVVAGVRRALRPGGRFVGEFGGHGNVAAICVALSAVLARRGIDSVARFSWYFPTVEEYQALLAEYGFAVEHIELLPRPTRLPTGLQGWLTTFAKPFLSALPEEEQRAAREEASALLAPVLRDAAGQWTADYVRLRFAARLRNLAG